MGAAVPNGTRVGVAPLFTFYDGDPLAFVISANANRRHVSTGQRAAVVALMLADVGKRSEGRWARGTVPPANPEIGNKAWANSIADAGLVVDHSTELAAQVASGEVALSAAVEKAREAKRERERDARHWAELQTDASDLAERVTDGALGGRHAPCRTRKRAPAS